MRGKFCIQISKERSTYYCTCPENSMELGQPATSIDLSTSEISSRRFKPHSGSEHRMLILAPDRALLTTST